MTLVAAIRRKEGTWIIADSQVSWGRSFKRTDLANRSKLAIYQHAVIGSSGRSLYGEALRRLAKTNKNAYRHEFSSENDVFNFFELFYDYIKEHYHLGNADSNDVQELSHSQFLVATPERLFEVSSCRDISEFDNYTAIGSGGILATAVMHAMMPSRKSAASILKQAYATASSLNTGVSGETDLLHVDTALPSQQENRQPKRFNFFEKKPKEEAKIAAEALS